ncbi:unnamed protein product [Prorocentrum cordatum]|uniref:C2 domain-containing protein n=1 Tax=Prorocentrum cordatum TaxID=2364126 RepID=A0ABN9X882_9DINO|nr:unnamed protein product [Polarella glacialis]
MSLGTHVTLQKAENLPDEHSVYCVLESAGEKQHTQEAAGPDPCWDRTLRVPTFPAGGHLAFSVCADVMGPDTILGRAVWVEPEDLRDDEERHVVLPLRSGEATGAGGAGGAAGRAPRLHVAVRRGAAVPVLVRQLDAEMLAPRRAGPSLRLGGGRVVDLRCCCDWTHPLAVLGVAAVSWASTPLVPPLALAYAALAGYADVVGLRRLRRPLPTPESEQLAARGGAILAWRAGARALLCAATLANAALLAWPAGLQGSRQQEEVGGADASSLALAAWALLALLLALCAVLGRWVGGCRDVDWPIASDLDALYT